VTWHRCQLTTPTNSSEKIGRVNYWDGWTCPIQNSIVLILCYGIAQRPSGALSSQAHDNAGLCLDTTPLAVTYGPPCFEGRLEWRHNMGGTRLAGCSSYDSAERGSSGPSCRASQSLALLASRPAASYLTAVPRHVPLGQGPLWGSSPAASYPTAAVPRGYVPLGQGPSCGDSRQIIWLWQQHRPCEGSALYTKPVKPGPPLRRSACVQRGAGMVCRCSKACLLQSPE
jgi:hypothetical protein